MNEPQTIEALEAELEVITANRDAWCERAGELLTEVNELRARAGMEG